ncbi:response regulator transcription factor [Neptuniibacter marinus]|uniref:response regulator transcription factor n=1 Tax=Neptuniibacter marinus TaxID=1806670 RepID=UPI003B5995AD
MHILLTDDDPDILSTIADHLELHNMTVDFAYNGEQALFLLTDNHYDVIVLDIMMPKLDGLLTCEALRNQGNTTPILMLTARDTLDDKVTGFQQGADDYLVKPFAMRELICRIEALGQRISRNKARTIHFGELELDLEQKNACRAGQQLHLNPLQFRLLKLLITQAPKIANREQIEQTLWQDNPPDSDALRSHFYQLRNIIDKPFTYPMLETIRGVGYRLTDHQSGDAS